MEGSTPDLERPMKLCSTHGIDIECAWRWSALSWMHIIAPNRSRRLTSADLLWNTDNNSYFSSKANNGFKDHHDKPSFVFSSKHPSATATLHRAKASPTKPKQQKQAPKVNHTDISEYPGSFEFVEEKPQLFHFSPNEGSNSFDCSEFPWGENCPKTPEITSLLSELDEATFMEEANPAKKPKIESVNLVSDCEISDDDLFFEMPFLQGAWDTSSVDAFLNGDSNQDGGNVMDLWSFDDLPPRRPIFSFQTLNITSYKFDVTESSALFVSAVASMTLVAQNPNRVGIRYDFSRLKILDDGLVVGMIRIPGFYQPARSHNVSVEIDIFFECLDITPIMSGVKTNNFTVKVVGDIGVHLRLLQIKLPKIKVGLDCDVAVDGRYLTSADEINSLQAVNNHVLFEGKNRSDATSSSTQLWFEYIIEDVFAMAVANRKSSFVLLLIIAVVVLCPLTRIDCHENIHKEVAVFVFGDSFFDPGNNNYINTIPVFQANYLPYGESYFSPPTGRFSDGRLIPDFIAEYARLPFIPPYLEPGNNAFTYGANFASSGAGTLIDNLAGLVVDLQTQLQYFGDLENLYRQNLGDTKAEQLLSNAVYLFSCGANDYISHVPNNLSISSIYPTLNNEQYTELVIGNLTNVIKGIYRKGGRKFGFLTVPLIGCFPALRVGQPGNTCNKEMNDIVRLHNQKLARKLEHLEKQLEGFMYAKFDISTAITNRMNNPSKYGFNEGETACCGNGPLRGIYSCGGRRGITDYELCDNATEFLFFDSIHPNEMADRQFAELFWKGDPTVTGPYNLKALFDGKP
ncbi:SGNH hydrolase-type esterase domain-containing protein [Artemisia annua]|uniref:SGNH hydrolase-type esterase domain-containing protein n=1 Tax=Artemisia annua TaxID=35608 RepID=A0A2U1NX17_ARTAN|nr:SGNH hydrolase-type esterase domain-containing protein [Artemisia annua]